MKILLTGDVHIGRRSSRLPTHADSHAHSSAAAWARIVDRAITEGVDLLAITGDLVDQSNRYLEAVGALESGFSRLAGAGIRTVVVAGNHDHDVLPRLLDSIGSPAVRLLGRGGRWERLTLGEEGERLHVDGWSFPHPHFVSSPLQSYRPVADGAPILALLHADLEQPHSPYAPVQLPELRRHPEVLFLLGHVHTPRAEKEPGGARYIYAGSPQALDRAEIGPHGVWLLERRSSAFEVQQVPLSSVRYLPARVDVEGVERAEEADARVFAAIRAALAELPEEADSLRCVRCRLRLTGRTRLAREIEARLSELAGDLELPHGAAVVSIESIWMDTSPAYDLDGLSGGVGPPAVLARLLADPDPGRGLRGELKRVVAEIHASRNFLEVSGGEEDLAELEEMSLLELRRSASVLLDELMRQKAPAS